MTYTGRLINEDAQVSIEGGPILAVRGSRNPIASAAGQYAVWGQTQPVTVTGVPDTVDNIPVLYVTSIQWAADAADNVSQGGVASIDEPIAAAPAKKKAARKRQQS